MVSQMREINSMSRGNTLDKKGTTNYYVLLGLPDKGRAINELIVFNDLDQVPLDLLNVCSDQPSPEL